MKKLVIASNNKGKIKEIKEILKDLNIDVFSLKDMNIDIDVEEDGDTFAANAKKKAVEIAKVLNEGNDKEFFVLSDDSGLCVDYLNGEPGVYSARYAGEHGDDKANNKKLLGALDGVKRDRRSGRFVCSMALVDSNLNCRIVEGSVNGIILEKESGEGGFGYDPLFFNEQLEKSFGEATAEEKNKISHRAIALNKLKELLWEIL
ncbi:MAG: XTP/dITP diphosphatase [Clostridium sp.]